MSQPQIAIAGKSVVRVLLQADRLGGAAGFDAAARLGDLQTEALSLQVYCCDIKASARLLSWAEVLFCSHLVDAGQQLA